MAKAPRPLLLSGRGRAQSLYGRSPIGKGTGLQNPLLKVRLLPAVHTRVSPIGWAPGRLPGEAGSIPASRSCWLFCESAKSSGERRDRRKARRRGAQGREATNGGPAGRNPAALTSMVSSILTPSTWVRSSTRRVRPPYAVLRPVRASGEAVDLSRRRGGFDSRTGCWFSARFEMSGL